MSTEPLSAATQKKQSRLYLSSLASIFICVFDLRLKNFDFIEVGQHSQNIKIDEIIVFSIICVNAFHLFYYYFDIKSHRDISVFSFLGDCKNDALSISRQIRLISAFFLLERGYTIGYKALSKAQKEQFYSYVPMTEIQRTITPVDKFDLDVWVIDSKEGYKDFLKNNMCQFRQRVEVVSISTARSYRFSALLSRYLFDAWMPIGTGMLGLASHSVLSDEIRDIGMQLFVFFN